MDAEDIVPPPYYETLGIEIVALEPGWAVARMPVGESVSAAREQPLAHGGAIASLADSAGYWAISAANGFATTPTIDLRTDYLAPATADLRAEATVVRNGESVGVVDVELTSGEETIATARGVFKTGGDPGDGSAWDGDRNAE